ncbi:unnamed protein product [Anisakis simplex]|uniref:Uncharacterized protein n=1 Tax=Anisakis simplex TaxID=6269 RepID=A0A0M3JQ48_ANISI|nr:unnamed protein product [Anisakis simplex]
MDRLSGCSGSFDQLSTDFLNLPPIPEAVPCRHAPHQSPEEEECDEDGDEPHELECCQKELDRCQMGAVKGQRSNSDPSGSTIISSSNFVVAAEGQARLARCDETDCCDEWTTQSPDLN